MARYTYSVKRGDKIITKIGTLRFFTKGEFVLTSDEKRPQLVRAEKEKRLNKEVQNERRD